MPLRNPEFAGWLVASLRSGVVAIDEEGRLLVLNEGARRVLGLPHPASEPPIGRPCREVLAGQPALVSLLVEALDGRERPSRTELVLRAPDGSSGATIGFTLVPVRDPAGRVRGAAMLFRDLTPYERMSEQERLRERLAALGEMAAGLAHEIRNPLAAMEVLGGLLRRRLADRPEEQKLAVELVGEIRRVAETVTECLEFVRPIEPRRAPVDPVALVEEALAGALARRPYEGAVERRFAPGLPPLVVDGDRIRTALTNLIANAFEAMEEAGIDPGERRVVLGIELEEREVADPPLRVDGRGLPLRAPARRGRDLVVSVSDTGPGVPGELRERIFYPFFTTKQHGSGVGLAQAQKIAMSHGGRLELDPGPGPGATFRLRLPIEPGAEQG